MAAVTSDKLKLWWQSTVATHGDRQAEPRREGRCCPPSPFGGREDLLPLRTKLASGQGLREPCRNRGHLRDPRLYPACPQTACQGVGVNSTNHGWQGTMTKVGKSDGEGTFAGTCRNDKVAPLADLPTSLRQHSDRGFRFSAPARSRTRSEHRIGFRDGFRSLWRRHVQRSMIA
jgi:hypothetical protein